MSGSRAPGPHEEPVGSLGEEAARLLGALGGWARDQQPGHGAGHDTPPDPDHDHDRDPDHDPGPDAGARLGADLGAVAAAAADRAAAAARQVGEHLATGDATCTWCPVCRTVHALRSTTPEVREQLVVAAGALLQVGTGLLAAFQAGQGAPGTARAGGPAGVEHIDLDDPDGPDDPGGTDGPDEWES